MAWAYQPSVMLALAWPSLVWTVLPVCVTPILASSAAWRSFHVTNQVVWVDDTSDGKVQTSVYRRDLGIRAHPARKGRMRKLSYEWLAGLREIVIDPVRCPLTYEEFVTKEYERDRDGTWLDIIPDGSDHSIDAVRYALMDVLRG